MKNSDKAEHIIQMWLDAEEHLRNGNDEDCQFLKDEFASIFDTLDKNNQKYVTEYLESIGA